MTVHSLRRCAQVVLLALCALPRVIAAQPVMERPDRDLPAWMTRWSPLGEIGSLSRTMPSAGFNTPLLMLPPPKLGLFWSGGNPAGLAWDVSDRRAELIVGSGAEGGTYKRPLDPRELSEVRSSGSGWRKLGETGAAVGSSGIARTYLDPSGESDLFSPYASPRLVVTDTSRTAVRRTHARLDGAAGWRLGDWGIGIALGYDTKTSESDEAAFVRRVRAVRPAASVGVGRQLTEWLTVGVHSTQQAGEEVVLLTPAGALGVVHQLEGYRAVPAVVISSIPHYRRVSRASARNAVSVTGRVGSTQWAAYGADVRRVDHFAGSQVDNPITEDWHSSGREAGVSVQRPLWGGLGLLTAEGRAQQVTGQGTLLGPSGTGLRTDEWRVEGSAELRLVDAFDRWSAVLRVGHSYEDRVVNDSAAAVRSHLRGMSPTFSGEFERPVGRGFVLTGGVAHTRFSGTGTIPDAAGHGPLYQRIFAPELDMMTSDIGVWALQGTVRWRRPDGTIVWLSARTERASSDTRSRDYAPGGNRHSTALTFGVVLP